MRYQSPVDLIVSEMNMKLEGTIFKAVQNVGVNVDRDELIKALQYDRQQYQKGYADRDAEIVRCKDCVFKGNPFRCRFDRDLEEHGAHRTEADDDWFCADGRKENG